MRSPHPGCGGRWSRVAASSVGLGGDLARRDGQRLAGAGEVGPAATAGEQAVVADAMEALGQDAEQKAADELAGCEGHRARAGVPVAAVVLVAEGDTARGEGREPAVGDGDAVGVAREVGQHALGSGEGRPGAPRAVPVRPPPGSPGSAGCGTSCGRCADARRRRIARRARRAPPCDSARPPSSPPAGRGRRARRGLGAKRRRAHGRCGRR